MERVQWLEYKGKKILYLNYTGLHAKVPAEKRAALDVIDKAKAIAKASPEKIRFLSDVTDTVSDNDLVNALKEFANYTAGLDKVEKECVVGVSGIQKVLVNMINLTSKAKLHLFDTLEQAKDWLVE